MSSLRLYEAENDTDIPLRNMCVFYLTQQHAFLCMLLCNMRFHLTQKHVCVSISLRNMCVFHLTKQNAFLCMLLCGSVSLRNMCVFPPYSGTCVCFHLTQEHVCVSILLRNMCVFPPYSGTCVCSTSLSNTLFYVSMQFRLNQENLFPSHLEICVSLSLRTMLFILMLSNKCFYISLSNMCF